MDHDKIEAVLDGLDYSQRNDAVMFNVTRVSVSDAADLIRDLRTECASQEALIKALEEIANLRVCIQNSPIKLALAIGIAEDALASVGRSR